MSFLSRLVSRNNLFLLLRLVIAGVLIAVIWFTGPKVGFGEARPLADVLPRLLVILFIIFLFITTLTRWHWSLTVLVTCILLLWVAGPNLSFGEGFFLTGVTTRLLLTGLMLVAWLVYYAVLWLRRRGRFRRPVADGETEISAGMDAMFRQVTRELQQRPKKVSRREVLTGLIQQQEAIPWYLILGSQGAGKTTAVRQCGQHFPLTGTLEPLSVSAGHPEQCRCWLANDAVYLDTDGKYISAAQSSQAEWLALQNALKSCRPDVAINGVLLMVSAPELMATDSDARDGLAATLRHRLSELRRIHDQFFPVYLVVTQLDYLCGFSEYFRGLSRQEQQDIWGISFPAGAGESLVSQQAEQQLNSLVQRIESDINIRLLKEYDPQDRKRMYGFPGDLAVLVQNLQQFLQTLFFPSRYDDTGNSSALRGVYFTSCYPGAPRRFTNPKTVIRQWADYVNPPAAPVTVPEAEVIRQQEPGHPFFLHQLFCELIIRDQSLAAKRLLTVSGPVIQHWLKHSMLLLLLAMLSYGLFRSYHNNAAYLQTITGKTVALREAQERFIRLDPTARPPELPPLLAGFRNLPVSPGLDLTDPGVNWRYGLFTGTRIARASESLYRWMLHETLLPFIRQYATRQLTLALAERSPETVYVSLRRYLMVYGIIPADLPFLTRDLSGLWPAATQLSVTPGDLSVTPHLTTLFSQPQSQLREPADEALIRRARALLAREDTPARIYLRLKNGLSVDAPPPLDLRQMAEDSSRPLFELQAEAPVSAIPGLFTQAGYQQVKKILLQLNTLAGEDKVVMGNLSEKNNRNASPQRMLPAPVRLYNAVMERYLSEYTRTWQHYLAEIRLRRSALTGHPARPEYRQAAERLGQLAAIDSPLFTLLQRSVAETTLAGYPVADSEKKPITADVAGIRQGLEAYRADRQSVLRRQVDNHFRPLRYFVRGGGEAAQAAENCQTDTPLCQLRAQLEELQVLLSAQRTESDKASPEAIAEFIAELLARSSGWPLPVRNMVRPLLEQIAADNRQAATARTTAGIAAGPAAYCRTVLAGRYPFVQTAREVSREDFVRFFTGEESAGVYFEQNLAGKTVMTGSPWHFKDSAPADSENRSLQMFSSARQIRQAFFPGGATQMSLPLKVSVPWLSPDFSRLELRTASQRLSYTHGPVRQTAINWPAAGDDPSITLSLTSAKTGEVRTRRFTGPWALFRWLDSAQQLRVTLTGEVAADFGTGDGSSAATLQIAGLAFHGEPLVTLLRRFTCP